MVKFSLLMNNIENREYTFHNSLSLVYFEDTVQLCKHSQENYIVGDMDMEVANTHC